MDSQVGDITITYNPEGDFYVIDGTDFSNLQAKTVLTTFNNELVKVPLTDLDLRVYDPDARAQEIADQIASLQDEQAKVEAQATAISVMPTPIVKVPPVSEPPIDTAPTDPAVKAGT